MTGSTHPKTPSIDGLLGQRASSRVRDEIWEQAAAFCVRRLPTLWTAREPRR